MVHLPLKVIKERYLHAEEAGGFSGNLRATVGSSHQGVWSSIFHLGSAFTSVSSLWLQLLSKEGSGNTVSGKDVLKRYLKLSDATFCVCYLSLIHMTQPIRALLLSLSVWESSIFTGPRYSLCLDERPKWTQSLWTKISPALMLTRLQSCGICISQEVEIPEILSHVDVQDALRRVSTAGGPGKYWKGICVC